jgi:hypothetical protein
MYAFLLVLGGAIIAAGLALVGSGVSLQDRSFDPTNVMPGTTAIIGGCVLIGLAFVVRALLRVEHALMARPLSRSTPPGEIAGVASAEQSSEPARIPFPPKSVPALPPQPAVTNAPPPTNDASLERLREKFPNLTQVESAPVVEETAVSLLPKAPTRPDEEIGEINNGHVPGRLNGAAPARTAPQAEVNARAARAPEGAKTSMFDSLWPKAQRKAGEATAPVPQMAPPPLPGSQPAEVNGSARSAAPPVAYPAAPAPLSVLKSGVVEGMAYTLYSDGSIEAQLPQGTLRFGSITELRDHIEQNS